MKLFRNSIPATLAAALVPLFGLLVVVRGFDADWDFRNYHWYNAYAWLTGRHGFDIAVAHHATYYNPLADVPVYLLAQLIPPWCVGFVVGCVHGLNLLLLYYLARAALGMPHTISTDWLALAIAVAGTTGGMALFLAGNASHDMTLSLFVLLALLLMVPAAGSTTAHGYWRFAAAGMAAGIAVGLKLTMAPFAIGLAAGTLVLPGPAKIRLQRVALLGAGGLAGAALFGGAWAWMLWQETGNPFFPYFNDIMGSPLLLDASYRDPRFLPDSLAEALIYPFLFAWDGLQVSDVLFRDIKIALAYAIVPLTLLWVSLSRRAHLTPAMRLLYTTCVVSYAIWLFLFGVYRYVLTLEMLAPLLIVLAVSLWPITEQHRWLTLLATWCLVLIGTNWNSIAAVGGTWRDSYVDVAVPVMPDPDHTLAVMAGVEPMGYLVPAFPPQIPFLRIDGWLDTPQSQSAFGDRMRARIDAHEGPIFGMFADHERDRAVAAFAADGLVLRERDCVPLESPLGEALLWCALSKQSAN